jgi:hypothetical protein
VLPIPEWLVGRADAMAGLAVAAIALHSVFAARFGGGPRTHGRRLTRFDRTVERSGGSVAAQCPTCHATTSFDAHDASVNLQLQIPSMSLI